MNKEKRVYYLLADDIPDDFDVSAEIIDTWMHDEKMGEEMSKEAKRFIELARKKDRFADVENIIASLNWEEISDQNYFFLTSH